MNIDYATILIKKAALEFEKMANIMLEDYNLTIAQYKVMKYLYIESDNGVRIADLERFYSMTHPTAIGIVQNLVKKDMVEYGDNPNDARSRYIVPTEKALGLRDTLVNRGEVFEKEFTKNLEETERTALISLLKKLLDV